MLKPDLSESKQETKVAVAYLGPRGTFSEAAARAWLQNSPQQHRLQNEQQDDIWHHECDSIHDVVQAVARGKARYGVVPVENSTEGTVNDTQDCLIDSSLHIVGERVVVIRHHLFARPGCDLDSIRRIASHRQSLAQCRRWLRTNCPDLPLHECTSNAQAACLSAEEPTTAAIAGSLAGEIYGLLALADDIQDEAHNSTRFLVLAGGDAVAPDATGRDKTSVLVHAENRPGALFRILQPFDSLQISLTRIETRPSRKEAWAYVFFIDFEGHREDEPVKELFRRLDSCTAEIKFLGSYPRCTA